jgi:carboxymethylenebutenolidase
MHDAMLAETVTITGHNGDDIDSYAARALQDSYAARALQVAPVGHVVVTHHLPGYDRQSPVRSRPAQAAVDAWQRI